VEKRSEQHRLRDSRKFSVTPAGLAAVLTQPIVLGILGLGALARIWSIANVLPERATHWDFSIYYLSGIAVHDGINPYTAEFGPLGEKLGLEVGEIHHATDPPTFLLLIWPLTLLGERMSYYSWIAFNAILLVVALVLLLDKSSGLDRRSGLALVALVVLYPPTYFHFFFAQSKIPLLLLLILMMKSMERGWDRAAGLCLAFAGLLRIIPLLLIGYLAIQRRWSVLVWTLIALAIGSVVTITVLGAQGSLSFRDGMTFLISERWLSLHGNIALGAAVSRLIWVIAGDEPGWRVELVSRFAIIAADAALLGATVWATLKLGPGHDPDWRGFSMWIVASVLLSPTAYVHYMVLFLIPFAQIAVAAKRSRATCRTQWLAILSYVLIPIATAAAETLGAASGTDLGGQWPEWLRAAAFEPLFFAALLTYAASYCFTLEAEQLTSIAIGAVPVMSPFKAPTHG
jgi:hypothetical protein